MTNRNLEPMIAGTERRVMENPKRPEVQQPTEYVNLTVRIPANLRKAIRRRALDRDISMQDVVIRALFQAGLDGCNG